MNEFYLTASPLPFKNNTKTRLHTYFMLIHLVDTTMHAYASYIPAVIAIKVAKITGALMVENCLL